MIDPSRSFRRLLATVAAALTIPVVFAQDIPKPDTDIAKQPAGDYTLDPTHASVTWRIAHLGLSQYTARFDKMDAKAYLNPISPAANRVEFTIDVASINTGLAPFNVKLQGAPYFDAEKNPRIIFKSTRFERIEGNRYRVTGDMTMRGVTKPQSFEVTFNGGLYAAFFQRHIVGFSAKGTVKRSDWGMTEGIQYVSDLVDVAIEAEFMHRPVSQ